MVIRRSAFEYSRQKTRGSHDLNCALLPSCIPSPNISSCDFPLALAGLCENVSHSDSTSTSRFSLTYDECSGIQSSNITIGLFNARSSVKKALDICDLITEKSLDILIITETWLHDGGDESAIRDMTPASFVFFHRPRSSGLTGGGLAVIHRSSITVKLCNVSTFTSFECLNFVISHGKHSVRTVALYRPPPSAANKLKETMFHEDFGQLVSSISNKNLLILGDFNFHWDEPDNRHTRLLVQLFDSADLVQHVSQPTHRGGHILDWVVSRSDKDIFVQSMSVEDLLMSDHFLIKFTTNMARPSAPKKKIQARNFKKMDMNSFRSSLSMSDLVNSPPDDVEQLVLMYNKTLSSLLDTYAPLTERFVVDRPDSAWCTPSVQKAKMAWRSAEKRWRRSGLEVDKQLFQKARNKCSQEIRHAKSKHVQNVLEEAGTDSRKMFSVVNDLLGKKSTPPVLPDISSEQAAMALSNFFSDKVETIRKNFGDHTDLPAVENVFVGTLMEQLSPVSDEQLRRIIMASKPTSFMFDPIPTKIMLDCLEVLLPVLVRIVNSSLQLATFPRLFKAAIIKPLMKKDGLDPNDCKSFRPVSNLPYVSKLLERVVSQQLLRHLSSNNLLDKFQSAYRPGHSCETALLRLLNDMLCKADCGDLTILVLLDLSAAFDVIDHELLLSRLLNEVGITGTAHHWFRSYLTDRVQRVAVNQTFSQDMPLSCGVPQGSVLGPILFSLYTSQLGRIIESHGISRKIFADDTELYKNFQPNSSASTVAVQALENCCLTVKSWMAANRLKLNDDKTEAILCGSDASLRKIAIESIKVGASEIHVSSTVRDLGFFIDRNLTMVPHIDKVVKACFFYLRALGQLRPQLNKRTAKTVAVSLIQSRLDYCNSCLWGLPQNQIQRLQKVQNTAARIVSLAKKSDHITPILKDLHWLPVDKRIDHKLLSLTYSCMDGTAPPYLQELIQKQTSSRGLRSSSQSLLRVPSLDGHKKKSLGVRSFESAAPKLWNSLPQKLRESDNKTTFKRHLKTFLFN